MIIIVFSWREIELLLIFWPATQTFHFLYFLYIDNIFYFLYYFGFSLLGCHTSADITVHL